MKYLPVILFFIITTVKAQSIVINELLSRNVITLQENCARNGCPDWIELHNTTNLDIDIGGYFLSDDLNDVRKREVPSGTVISANGFLLLFGNDATSGALLKVNFNLSRKGETLILSDRSGTQIQEVIYPALHNDVSYGRLSDGSYARMSTPSPRVTNPDNVAFEYLDSNLAVSLPSGV